MNTREMDLLINHFNQYFNQPEEGVLHSDEMKDPHIDLVLFRPNEEYPFWKLVTMGASDYRMPKLSPSLGDRNEYMLFIPAEENLRDRATLSWYASTLVDIAVYPYASKTHITYGHSVEWGDNEESDMVGAFLEMPQVVAGVGILRCKLGLFKQAICLQAKLLTRSEMQKLLQVGPQEFSNYLYPEDDSPQHFLSTRYKAQQL